MQVNHGERFFAVRSPVGAIIPNGEVSESALFSRTPVRPSGLGVEVFEADAVALAEALPADSMRSKGGTGPQAPRALPLPIFPVPIRRN